MICESEIDAALQQRQGVSGWAEAGPDRRGIYLLQGLQYCLTVHLQHMQPGLILDPAVGHHCHQVEADVVVGLPAVTAAAVRAAPTPVLPSG